MSFLDYLKTAIQGSFLVSALGTNLVFGVMYGDMPQDLSVSPWPIIYYPKPGTYQTCGRENIIIPTTLDPVSIESVSILERSEFFPTSNSTIVRGFFAGCTPFEAILESTLDCLYDYQCLQLLLNYFPKLQQVRILYISLFVKESLIL